MIHTDCHLTSLGDTMLAATMGDKVCGRCIGSGLLASRSVLWQIQTANQRGTSERLNGNPPEIDGVPIPNPIRRFVWS